MLIKEVLPRIIKDSNGQETVEIEVRTKKGKFYASAPNGKSIGKYENPSYSPRGIRWSLKLMKILCSHFFQKNLLFRNFSDLEKIEEFIKKFEEGNDKLGTNFVYALEVALAKAAAVENSMELFEFIKGNSKLTMPGLISNCVGGGINSNLPKRPDFQEFLVISKENLFSRSVNNNIHIFWNVKNLLKKKENKWKLKNNRDGSWQTSLHDEDVLDIMKDANKFNAKIGVDVAGSWIFDSSKQNYLYEEETLIRDKEEHGRYIQSVIDRHKLFYIEDAFQGEDFNGFSKLKIRGLNVSNDLASSNIKRMDKAVDKKAINSVIIKPNQIGYLGELVRVVNFCRNKNLKVIFSQRNGETMDDSLADLAVAFDSDYVKIGIHGKERLVKLKRLLELEKKFLR